MKDELKIVTPMLKGFITKAIKKVIAKKMGYNIDLVLNDIYISTDENGAHVHLNANADIDRRSFDKMLGEIM